MATIEEINETTPETTTTTETTTPETTQEKKTSRGEKKTKAAMAKLGMTPVDDIFRVTLKQTKGFLCVVASPEVYTNETKSTYVIFGETTFEDPTAARATKAAKNLEETTKVETPVETTTETTTETSTETTKDDSEVDLQGLDEKDVEIVMKETKAPKAKVVEVLKKTGDIVTAVLELTM
ncbi:putative nascent polypeptide-associated complex alpha subunit [Tieghemostelium lacteum]|uniref:Putative nascent polypeptide-associated complex alpha subunit n=1 Tax=Tieghemostelium lacteum TaxID=361077 RepID=A0A151Z8D1_TIELA|nr:putative nascent polypeptide-associated complex alpha subunit [Tieghemostelium lacteum]|eukprot:KYQ90197.1 putative nascent polypeptide-associated complex alpha subunit [Tieghemostelium lacteum]